MDKGRNDSAMAVQNEKVLARRVVNRTVGAACLRVTMILVCCSEWQEQRTTLSIKRATKL